MRKGGLYKANTDELIYSWEQMIQDKIISVMDDELIFYNKYDNPYNLEGDFVIDNSIRSIRMEIPPGSAHNMYFAKTNKIVFPAKMDQFPIRNNYAWHNFEQLEVDPENPLFYSLNNCVIERSTQTLMFGCKNSAITSDMPIKILGNQSLYNCRLTHITLPKSLELIDCDALGYNLFEQIEIPDGTKDIYSDALSRCFKLKKCVIGTGAEYINLRCFNNCPLEEIIFKDPCNWKLSFNVQSYGTTFSYCQSTGGNNYYGTTNTADGNVELVDLSNPQNNAKLLNVNLGLSMTEDIKIPSVLRKVKN